MKERFFIVLSLLLIIIALVALNTVSYAPVERTPDVEARPNRSTYNPGTTGTRAFYDFLRETNRPVVRWQEKASALLRKSNAQPKTFVIIGKTRQPFDEGETRDLLKWVEAGGKLVLIDREPTPELLPPAGTWLVSAPNAALVPRDAQPDNVNQMTEGVTAAKPAQPTALIASVNSVMPSKFATKIKLERVNLDASPQTAQTPVAQPTISDFPIESASEEFSESSEMSEENEDLLPPAETNAEETKLKTRIGSGASASEVRNELILNDEVEENSFVAPDALAPVVHLSSGEDALLVDYPYGAGKITFLSDPYIVSNSGIELVDNLRLATNIVGDANGLIAFDEYHQGYGASGNAFLNFFAGTPLPAIAAQLALIAVLAIYTRGRRFARPLPLPNPDRRSKLEYVAAMAELQRRTKAYDLALENIYGRVRRELGRFAGVDNSSTPPRVLAERVAERSRLPKDELTNLFQTCEDVIHGEQINDKKALSLVARLREIERELGLKKVRKL